MCVTRFFFQAPSSDAARPFGAPLSTHMLLWRPAIVLDTAKEETKAGSMYRRTALLLFRRTTWRPSLLRMQWLKRILQSMFELCNQKVLVEGLLDKTSRQ